MHGAAHPERLELLADRFLVRADGSVVDAATGAEVRLTINELTAHSAEQQEALAERLARGQELAPGRLIDYGGLDATRTFEAHVVDGDAWSGRAGLFERVSIAALEVLGHVQARPPGLWRLALDGSRERRVAREAIARVARHGGIVPVCRAAALSCPGLPALVVRRSVVLLAFGEDECASADASAAAVGLASLLPARVLSVVVCTGRSEWDRPSLLARYDRAARLHPYDRIAVGTGRVGLRVAESPATYVAHPQPGTFPAHELRRTDAAAELPDACDTAKRPASRPAEEPHDAVLARVDRLVAGGRAAEAERQLRVAHAAARRRDEAPQRQVAYARGLARVLLGTGRVRDAVRLLRDSQEVLRAAAGHVTLLELNTHLGHALIEAAEIEEAAGLLQTSWLASIQLGRGGHALTALALARARWWGGDPAGVQEALGWLAAQTSLAPPERTEWAWRLARLHRKQRRLAEASQLLAQVLGLHGQASGAAGAGLHAEAMALQAELGDLVRAREHYRRALAASGRGLPLHRARIRVGWCEALAAAGQRGRERERLAAGLAARPARLSPLLRQRLQQARTPGGRDRREGPAPWARTRADADGLPCAAGVDELLEVLQICHSEDEARALSLLCALVRERLEATSVCVYGGDADVKLAWTGGPRSPSPELARRAMATGALLPAGVVNDGLEAAVAVRYGGVPIAALSCRWSPDRVVDDGRASVLLSTVAAACAPSVRVALDRRVVASGAPADDMGLVGVSRAMATVRAATAAAANAPFPVLVEGESGCGKELIARAIHRLGPRRHRKFCAVNCAAMSDDLLEAELFGHTRGAFTGAVAERVGLFEEADDGTLLLDEVGELSPRAQAKLLRVLQEGELRRVGENIPRRIDVRIVAATNRCLATETARGRFRDDLRYRLDVIHIAVPPLRARPEDIPLLAASFWQELASRIGSRAVLDPATIDALSRYDWPGNVRELQNVLAALAAQAPRRGRLLPSILPARLRGPASPARTRAVTLDLARREFDTGFVSRALAQAGGRRSEAAKALGLTRQGLAKLMARLGIADADTPAPPP
jgi:DNA-binding NtrC family response regulator/tetratricopeptide (TPR) repeat protein